MNQQKSKTQIFDRLGRKPVPSNVVTPNIFVGPTWLRDDEPSTVEIIELNSSNEEVSPRELNGDNRRHAWSYVNDEEMRHIENSYKINKRARERRRLQNSNHLTAPVTYTTLEPNWDNPIENNFYISQANRHVEDKLDCNDEINYFSIMNKHIIKSDTSSDEEYGEVEVITSADVIMGTGNDWNHQYNNNNNFYNEEVITYDADLDQEQRTIWIYSFKNKHLLTDDDFEAVPNKESSSSSYSTDSSGEQMRENSGRVGSPTPTYIPRLNLSLVPTLSTVMEMSERNDKMITSVKSTSRIRKVHANNWCVSDTHGDGGHLVGKRQKSTNIINWMGLSPREQRVPKHRRVNDTWIGSHLNLTEFCSQSNKENCGYETNKRVQNNAVKIQADVEVYVDREANGDKCKIEPNSASNEVKAVTDENNSITKIYDDARDFQKDRGDHDVKLVTPSVRVPKRYTSNRINHAEDPDNHDWIHEKLEKETNVYDYVLERSESILDATNRANTIDHLWMKNTVPFLKPAQWTKFKPIADSPRSYHLSIGSIEERQTWFKRLINFLRCCK